MDKKKASINIITIVCYQILNIIIGLFLPKLYTETFGSIYNGLNQTITQIMQLLGLLQAGISVASIQALFNPINNNDEMTINSIFDYTEKQYKKMSQYFIIVILAIGIIWPIISKENINNNYIFLLLIISGGCSLVDYFVQAKYTILITAHNKTSVIYILNIITLILGTILRIFILINFKDIVLYQLILLVMSILRTIMLQKYVKKHYPFIEKRQGSAYINIKDRKDVFIGEIAGFIIDCTDMVVISTFIGFSYSSVYSIYYLVVSGVGNIMNSVRQGIFAGLGQMYFSNKNIFKETFCKFETFYFALMFWLYSITIIMYIPFIKVYTFNMDQNYVFKYLPLMFITVKMLVDLRTPSIICVNAAGHFKQVKNYAIIEAMINLTLSLLLVNYIGLIGVLLGSIIGGLYRTPLYVNYANKNVVNRSNKKYIVKISILSIPYILSIIFSFIYKFNINSFFQWAKYASVITFILFSIYALIVFALEKEIYLAIKNKIINIIKKDKNKVAI